MKKIVFAFAALGLLSACGTAQSPECAQYIECAAHYDELMDTTTDLATSEPDGSCWANAATAEGCTAACKTGLEAYASGLAAAGHDVGPCGDGGGGGDGGAADAG